MAAFSPITPLKAVELLEAAGVPNGRQIIPDYAAAQLVKSYALVRETIEAAGARACVRDAAVPAEVWQRVIRESVADQIWAGGTVRLAGSDLIGGVPAVNVTGITFKARDLQRMVDHYNGHAQAAKPKRAKPVPSQSQADSVEEPIAEAPAPSRRKEPNLSAIPPGALLATIKEAEAALGYRRTKINEFMKSGRLERVGDVGAPRITVASIRAFAGVIE